jgi:hypothetical protein
LNVIALPSMRRRILCVTEGGYRHSQSLRQHDGTLRGKGLKCERMGHAKNAPVRIQVGTPGHEMALPADWDLLACLCRIWGILPSFFNNRIHDVPPNTSPRPHRRRNKAQEGWKNDE